MLSVIPEKGGSCNILVTSASFEFLSEKLQLPTNDITNMAHTSGKNFSIIKTNRFYDVHHKGKPSHQSLPRVTLMQNTADRLRDWKITIDLTI